MRFARTIFLTIAFVLSSATAFPVLRAAESAPAATPEKIEFSRSSSTTPKIPRPGLKNDDRLKNYGNVQDGAPKGPEFLPPPVAPTTVLPSKAAAKKLLEEWDRKKNWAVPTDDNESEDALGKVGEPSEDSLTGPEKTKSVMDAFMAGGSDSKKKNPAQSRSRDSERDKDRRDNRLQLDDQDRDRDDRRDDNNDRDDRERDPNDNSESNGLAAFNLKKFIREQNGMAAFKDQQLPRAAQLFRSEIGNGNQVMDSQQLEKDRTERQARSAEFMQMIKPRATGSFAGSDPVNAPDLTRREANPVTPRGLGSSSELSSSPFNGPSQSPASRIQDNAMFGATGPAGSSISPSVNAPAPRPVDPTRRQIVIDAPRRIGF